MGTVRIICVVTGHRWHIDHDSTHYEAVVACLRCRRWHPPASQTAVGPRVSANLFTTAALTATKRR